MEAFSAIVFDETSQRWRRFSAPLKVLTTFDRADVPALLDQVEQQALAGNHAVGYVSYEAAPGLDRALPTQDSACLPMAQFAVFDHFEEVQPAPAAQALALTPDTTFEAYQEAIQAIRAYLHSGDSYQVNYTYRLAGTFEGDLVSLFWSLNRSQPSPFAVCLETADLGICSVSPELFFDRQCVAAEAAHIHMQPMKGTRPRGRFSAEDDAIVRELKHAEKDRAENLMIVDMIRNDLGRVAEAGSVKVDALFSIKRLPTVWQQVSDVSARSNASLGELFAALFPCASVTGAPKARTMDIIREIESSPRGVYTGAIGLVKPGGDARFSVAIRTLTLDKPTRRAVYGVGGGIVWDSHARAEWLECRDKARVLAQQRPEFRLLETMRYDPGEGVFLQALHLERMRASADYFGFSFSEQAWLRHVNTLSSDKPLRLRLLLSESGEMELQQFAFAPDDRPVRLRLSDQCVSSDDVFLFHKTTHRAVYDRAAAGLTGIESNNVDDVVLTNERGEVTETTIANLFIERNGELLTPAVDCGLLAGTYRQYLLDQGRVRESVITVDELKAADCLYVANALRGLRSAQLVP